MSFEFSFSFWQERDTEPSQASAELWSVEVLLAVTSLTYSCHLMINIKCNNVIEKGKYIVKNKGKILFSIL